MEPDRASRIVEALRARGVMAHLARAGLDEAGVTAAIAAADYGADRAPDNGRA